MGGTLRALTHEHMMYLKGRIEEMVASVAAGYRCNGTVDWHLEDHPYYPPTVNNPGAAAFVQEVASELLGSDKVRRCDLTAGGVSWVPAAEGQ
jgi:IAA-amino acid hydrolase